jgi:hypothetical protein
MIITKIIYDYNKNDKYTFKNNKVMIIKLDKLSINLAFYKKNIFIYAFIIFNI